MPPVKHNSTMDTATGLLFLPFDTACAEMCLFANHSMYDTCIVLICLLSVFSVTNGLIEEMPLIHTVHSL